MTALSAQSSYSFGAQPDGITSAGLDVPSAQPLDLYEVLVDQVGDEAWVRFRFVAREIGKSEEARAFAEVEGDFAVLCEEVAQPYLREYDLSADVVAISMMSRPVDFGVSDPEVTQFVEVFRVSSGTCDWEGL